MVNIRTAPGTQQKLSTLSVDSQYDLACACGTSKLDRRHRGKDDKWIYPVTLQNGGQCALFKTLISNVCVNDCKYCPLRSNRDPRRCTLEPEETVRVFQHYLRAGKVFGLFLSSGVIDTPDLTMDRLNAVARILRRKEGFKGYIHLKIIPGASDAAVEEAVSLSTAVSLNIETAGDQHFRDLSSRKDYMSDIIHPLKLISRLTGKGCRYSRVKQSTQFVVGASDETDREIVRYSWGLYRKLRMGRVYFSAYQRGLGDPGLPGEHAAGEQSAMFTREHRLYQADWLMRKYRFDGTEIPFDEHGNLSLTMDPKEHWATLHPDRFPVDANRADRYELLRVPGLGAVTVDRILKHRAERGRLTSIRDIGRPGKRLNKAIAYLQF